MAEPDKFSDFAAIAWARAKVATGQPDEAFTTRDREMFELGLAWVIAEEVEE